MLFNFFYLKLNKFKCDLFREKKHYKVHILHLNQSSVPGETEQVQEHPGPGGLLPVPVPVPAVQRCVLDPVPHRYPGRLGTSIRNKILKMLCLFKDTGIQNIDKNTCSSKLNGVELWLFEV